MAAWLRGALRPLVVSGCQGCRPGAYTPATVFWSGQSWCLSQRVRGHPSPHHGQEWVCWQLPAVSEVPWLVWAACLEAGTAFSTRVALLVLPRSWQLCAGMGTGCLVTQGLLGDAPWPDSAAAEAAEVPGAVL